ncbi:MAG: TolC family protein [Puniceicoccales bacterium]
MPTPELSPSAVEAPPPPVNSEVLATLVDTRPSSGPSLTIGQAMALALKNNFTRKISQENVASARASVEQSRGPVLPQLSVGASYQQVNRDQYLVESGFSPEKQSALNFTASQIIYNDSLVTNLRSTKRQFEAAQESDKSVALDIAEQAGLAYVNVLAIASNLKIAEDNLRITRENLEIAEVRRSVGTSGPEEILRFQSEEAQQESELWSQRNRLHSAMNDLNQLLGEPPDRTWQLEDLSLHSDVFRTSLSVLIPLANSEDASDRFRMASIEFALARSPEVASLGYSAAAQRLLLNESRRSFFVPDVAASFEYSHPLDSEYPGASVSESEEDTWTFLVSASLPIFEGGARFGDIRQARAGLRSLQWEDARTRQNVSVNVSNALAAMASSWQSIRLSRIASERADANLDIVQEKYQQGSVSIVDLLDAQNNALVQKLTASIDLYRFFQDLISYQRALSWAEPLANPQNREEFVSDFLARLEND